MMMKAISVFDKKYTSTASNDYALSIQINLDGFSFLVRNTITGKIIGLKHIPYPEHIHPDDLSSELHKTLEKEPLVLPQYAEVKIMFWTQKSTLIPAPLFDGNNLKSYFEFNVQLGENDAIYCNHIKNCDSYIAYCIPSDVSTICGIYLSNAQFYCQSHPLIHTAVQSQKSSQSGCRVFVQVTDDFFDIVVANEGSLQLHNSFGYTCTADFIYFVLNIFEQFKLSPESTPVYLGGNIGKLSNEYIGLSRYIRQLNFIETYSEEKFTHAFIDTDLHHFSALIELQSCE